MSIITGFGDDDVGACAHANKQVDNPSENDFLSYIYLVFSRVCTHSLFEQIFIFYICERREKKRKNIWRLFIYINSSVYVCVCVYIYTSSCNTQENADK